MQVKLQDVHYSSQFITSNLSKPTLGLVQAGCPSCHPINCVKALKGKALCVI